MKKKHVKVVIVGAGSAGLSAMRQIRRETRDFVIVDKGPLGTTCARVGCMPSKALIHVARQFHGRHAFEEAGLRGAEGLSVDLPAVLAHIRRQRDSFAGAMEKVTRDLAGEQLVMGEARLLGPQTVQVGATVYEAQSVILATGASPVVPEDWWRRFGNRLLTYDSLFDQETLAPRIAVLGLGPIGLELGQALARLGLDVVGYHSRPMVGGLTDPEVNAAALTALRAEFPIHVGVRAGLEIDGNAIRVGEGAHAATVDQVLIATGTRPNLRGLGLETLGVPLDDRGVPPFEPQTMQVADLPVFIAGDVNSHRPILHEALDDGFIAGRNALAPAPRHYCRRTPLKIVFSEPQIIAAGRTLAALDGCDLVIGSVDFADQSRVMIEGTNRGLMRLYADAATGVLLGAEAACPGAEHFGHMLAWAVQRGMTVAEMLQLPFYHPVEEEAIRSALQDAAEQLHGAAAPTGPALCAAAPEAPMH
jgi:dihydrolipoamide dehydrogenase